MVGLRRRALVLALAAAALALSAAALAVPAAAQAGWSRPFVIAPPGSLDVIPPQLAISGGGAAAVAFGIEDVDTPGSGQGWLALRASGGGLTGPEALPGTSQILSLAYDGGWLELLAGAAPAGQVCCSSAQAIRIGAGGKPEPTRTLVGGLTGTALGHLVVLADGQMLAAVATERGVWVAQSARANRFGAPHLLTGAGQMPEAMATAGLGGERSLVAWTAAAGPAGASDPRTIDGAEGSRTSAPRRVRTLVSVPAGHRIDEIGLAPRGAGRATVVWIESWYDAGGGYHSVVRALDLVPHATAQTLSPPGRLAAGLSAAGDAAGDQAVTWQSCTQQAACTADAVVRRARGGFGAARSLGAVDPSQTPALSVGSRGLTVVGWVRGGDPVAAIQSEPGRGFGQTVVLSRAGYALDVTVAAGQPHAGLVAWSQGTLHPSVVAAAYGP